MKFLLIILLLGIGAELGAPWLWAVGLIIWLLCD